MDETDKAIIQHEKDIEFLKKGQAEIQEAISKLTLVLEKQHSNEKEIIRLQRKLDEVVGKIEKKEERYQTLKDEVQKNSWNLKLVTTIGGTLLISVNGYMFFVLKEFTKAAMKANGGP